MTEATGLDPKRRKQIREFGVVMALALVILGGVLLWRGRETSLWMFSAALLFFAGGIFCPKLLDPLERGWMFFAKKLSVVSTFIILTLAYVTVVTPMAIFLRVLKKDILSLNLDPGRTSYWEPVDQNGPGSRHYLPF